MRIIWSPPVAVRPRKAYHRVSYGKLRLHLGPIRLRFVAQSKMIRHADSLVLVWKVAEMEAQHLGSPLIEPVHYFLGLLKVVDVDLDQVNSLRERGAVAVEEITQDIGDLRLAFDRADVETTPLRRRLN